MIKISPIDKIKWGKKLAPLAKKIATSKSEQDKLIKLFRDNGYSELADVADEARIKYGDALFKSLS